MLVLDRPRCPGDMLCASPRLLGVRDKSPQPQHKMGKELPLLELAQAPRPSPLPLEAALVLSMEKAACRHQAAAQALSCRAPCLPEPNTTPQQRPAAPQPTGGPTQQRLSPWGHIRHVRAWGRARRPPARRGSLAAGGQEIKASKEGFVLLSS